MNQPGAPRVATTFELTDLSATKPAKILWEPPEAQEQYNYRWWGARHLLATETITAIIGQMTPRQMFIVHFRLEGMTIDQIATRMYLSPSTVRQHLVRLRQRIYENIPDLRLRLIYCYHYRHPLDPRQTHPQQ